MDINDRFKKAGFCLVFGGKSDGVARHYPNGFVYRWKGDEREDKQRLDTVKCIPEGFEFWEWARHCMCNACKDGTRHASDCFVHNMPAYPNGPCDCEKERHNAGDKQ